MKPASEEDFIVTSTADLSIPLTLGTDDRELVAFMAFARPHRALGRDREPAQDVPDAPAREDPGARSPRMSPRASISPADARTMMGSEESEFDKKIADAVAWGMLSSKKAEQLLRAMRDDRESRERGRAGA